MTSVLSAVDYRPIPVHNRFVPVGRDEAQGHAEHHALLGAGVFAAAGPHTGLAAHPNALFVEYVLSGIRDGFRVGFDYTTPLRSAHQNMLSAVNHPTVVTDYVEGERAKGRIIGPLPVAPGPGPGADGGAGLGLHVNRMGVIPKGHTPRKW